MKKEKLGHFQNRGLALSAALVLVILALTTVIVMAQPDEAPAAVPDAITVTKEAETTEISADGRLAYTVIFSNSSDFDVALDVITDVLPSPFEYWGLAAGTDPAFNEPGDPDEPEIVWQGTFTVPATDTLTLRYWVSVPETTPASDTPYTNTLTAAYGATSVGPAEAGVTVVSPDISVSKTASPLEIDVKDMVTYTVVWENDGNAAGVIDLISDTLPAGFKYQATLPDGTITDAPAGSTGTIVWTGPYTVEAGAAVTLTYQAEAETKEAKEVTNKVVALIDGETTDPATAMVTFGTYRVHLPTIMHFYRDPRFVVTKKVNADKVLQGETVIYTVEFTNVGIRPGTIDKVLDTLPAGFTFLGMENISQVKTNPVNSTGTLAWNGPFEVGAERKLTLVYKVQVSDVPDTYVNTATATTIVGNAPAQPATATVTVKEPFLLEEDFESGTDDWEPFLNYWRLYPEQWYTKNGAGASGSTGLNHNFCLGVTDPRGCERGAHDALYMYKGAGAEDWQNYRLEAKMNLRNGEKGYQMGLWFRGQHREPADPKIDGKYVSGYYVVFAIRERNSIVLTRLRDDGATAEHFSDPEALAVATKAMVQNQWYDFRVDVVDNSIQIYVDGEQMIDHSDSTWGTGTIGFFAYKAENATWDNIVVTPLD